MKKLLLFSTIAITIFGCGPKKVYNQPGTEASGYFETAWIDPKVVLDDPWYTLLRSNRIDSFYVDSPPDNSNASNRSIKLVIKSYECLAIVNMINGRSEIVRPLLAKNLGPGYYKFTVNAGQLSNEQLPPGNYFLKAEYCGQTVIQDLGWR
ncbi:MAG: hypothetical protein ACREBV_06890 [Candidatus Zixiibacteriota bacterium]